MRKCQWFDGCGVSKIQLQPGGGGGGHIDRSTRALRHAGAMSNERHDLPKLALLDTIPGRFARWAVRIFLRMHAHTLCVKIMWHCIPHNYYVVFWCSEDLAASSYTLFLYLFLLGRT